MSQKKFTEGAEFVSLPDHLTGIETSRLIGSVFGLVKPQYGVKLMEPQVVLTLAGARGLTEFYLNSGEETDFAVTAAILNEQFNPRGIFFTQSPVGIRVINLYGVEQMSKRTKIRGIVPYQSSTGFDGVMDWARDCESRVDADILSGVARGYPDVAVLGHAEWIESGKDYPLSMTRIVFANYYDCPQPNFLVKPEHLSHPSVQAVVSDWGKTLVEFYGSPWHLGQLKNDVSIGHQSRKS